MGVSSGPSGLLLEPLLGFETLAGPDGKPLASRFKEVEKAVAVSGSNLVLRLKKPCAPLLSILAAYCPAKRFVFFFRVYNDYFRTKHKGAQSLEFNHI